MATPTNTEQEMLELINRARMNPLGEYDRLIVSSSPLVGANPEITGAINFFNVNTVILRQQLAGASPVAPVAWNSALGDAASLHSAAMINADQQTHQAPGEAGLGARAQASGYNNWSAIGENVFAFSKNILQGHAGFYIDWGNSPTGMQQPAGHRNNILSANFTEVGIDISSDNNASTNVGPLVVTQDFGTRFDYRPQILGVAFQDADGDNFYDAGEGLEGQIVTFTGATGSFATTTWSSGGYQLEVPTGAYTATFTGAGSSARSYSVTINAQNVHLNNNAALPAIDQNVFLDTSSSNTYDGGIGLDSMVYSGARAAFQISGNASQLTVVGTGTDTLANIERLQFTDAIVAFDTIGNAGDAYRIYQAAFDRTPDRPGLSYWVNQMDDGMPLSQVALNFILSPEFTATYGDINAMTNAQFVDVVYENVLHRDPDQAGFNYWMNDLANGYPRHFLLTAFSQSAENQANVAAAIQNGILLDLGAFV